MRLNDIIENKNLNKMMKSYISECYGKHKVSYYMEYEDYEQEIYIYLINHLKSYDESKSSISTFLYMCISTKSLNLVRGCKAKKRNKDIEVSLNNIACEGSNRQKEYEEIIADSFDIEKEFCDSELIDYLIDYYKDNKYMKNMVIYLSMGYNKKQLEDLFGYCHTTLYKKIGKANRIGTLAYVINQYKKKEVE